MEDKRLHISQAEYLPEHECVTIGGIQYSITEAIMQRLNLNNIKAKELSDSSIEGEEKQEKEKKALKYIYPEEMLYLTYVSQYQSINGNGLEIKRENWEELKQRDISTIYANLSQKGFNKWQFIQFYIKIRKRSKIIERFHPQNQTSTIPIYRIFRNIKDYREKKNDQLHYLTQKNEKISNILQNLKIISAKPSIKIQILFNLDGVILLSKPSFKIQVKNQQ